MLLILLRMRLLKGENLLMRERGKMVNHFGYGNEMITFGFQAFENFRQSSSGCGVIVQKQDTAVLYAVTGALHNEIWLGFRVGVAGNRVVADNGIA